MFPCMKTKSYFTARGHGRCKMSIYGTSAIIGVGALCTSSVDQTCNPQEAERVASTFGTAIESTPAICVKVSLPCFCPRYWEIETCLAAHGCSALSTTSCSVTLRGRGKWAEACARSSLPQAVSMPLMRTITSLAPKPPLPTASRMLARACALALGATASSRSKMAQA